MHPSNFQLLTNDQRLSSMEALVMLKSVIVAQLPRLQPVNVIKNLMVCWNHSFQQIIGGVCFRVWQRVEIVEILYFVTNKNFQGKGFGLQLMNQLKEEMKKRDIQKMVAYADDGSLQFYHRVGFVEMSQQESCKQKWKPYIYEFEGSKLMVCQVQKKLDYENLKAIVETQYQQALDLLDNVKSKDASFSREEADRIVNDQLAKYFKNKGISYIQKAQKLLVKSTLLTALKDKSEEFIESRQSYRSRLFNEQKQLGQLYQIAIIEKIRSLSESWILNIPFRYHNQNSKLESVEAMTLQQMEHNVYDGQYFTSSELCAQIYEAMKQLDENFPNDSSYIKDLRDLEDSLVPFLEQIQQGTFDIYEHYQKELK